jgi:hypothetical protein
MIRLRGFQVNPECAGTQLRELNGTGSSTKGSAHISCIRFTVEIRTCSRPAKLTLSSVTVVSHAFTAFGTSVSRSWLVGPTVLSQKLVGCHVWPGACDSWSLQVRLRSVASGQGVWLVSAGTDSCDRGVRGRTRGQQDNTRVEDGSLVRVRRLWFPTSKRGSELCSSEQLLAMQFER